MAAPREEIVPIVPALPVAGTADRRWIGRQLLLALVLSLVATTSYAQIVTDMTPERIREAIALGIRQGKIEPYKMKRVKGPGDCKGWERAEFSTPFLRVAMAANQAKKSGRPFTEADATGEMVANEVHISGLCRAVTSMTTAVALDATDVTLTKGGQAVERISMWDRSEELRPHGYTGPIEAQTMIAAFPLSAVGPDAEAVVSYLSPSFMWDPPSGEGRTDTCEGRFRFSLDKVR